MRAVLLLALLATGCVYHLDRAETDANTSGRSCKVLTAASCQEADSHADFTWIKGKIFAANCFGSSCHSGPTATGMLDLTEDPYTALMRKSHLEPDRDLIVPGKPNESFLFFMIRGVTPEQGNPPFTPPPSNVGYMPMSNTSLCCQKIDAIGRWITEGALNN